MTNVKVYVGTYGKYNAGNLFGKWLDLSDYMDHDEFIDAARELHNDENDPELMFQDYEAHEAYEGLISESYIDPKIWDIMDYMENEEPIALHNEFCSPDDRIMTWDEIEEWLSNISGADAFRAGAYADISWSHEFFRFNGYGNLESTDYLEEWIDWAIIQEGVLQRI